MDSSRRLLRRRRAEKPRSETLIDATRKAVAKVADERERGSRATAVAAMEKEEADVKYATVHTQQNGVTNWIATRRIAHLIG